MPQPPVCYAKEAKLLRMPFLIFLAPCLILAAALLWAGSGAEAEGVGGNPRVRLSTSLGDIVLELYPQKAPVTVANFLEYVRDGFYNGTVFHRVINGFMIQGGGLTADLRLKATRPPIKNEADNGLTNQAFTVAMARTPDPDSASAQFFINLEDNDFLNHTAKTQQGWGYAVFGKVVDGTDVVQKIGKVQTTTKGPYADVPVTPVVIKEAVVLEEAPR